MALLKIVLSGLVLGVFFLANSGYGQSDENPCEGVSCSRGFYCQPFYPNCSIQPCPVIPPKCMPIPTDRGCTLELDNPCVSSNIQCLRGYYCQPQYQSCDAAPTSRNGPKCMPIPYENGEPSRDYSPCANVTCSADSYCSFTIIYCFTTPCNQPPPRCVKIAE